MRDVVTIGGAKARIMIVTIAVLAISTAYFGAKWQLGDMLARLTSPTDPNATIVADAAIGLAPSDPYASALRADIFDPNSADTRSAVVIAQDTVRLSPFDHRWHLALARALSSDGQIERAEAEFKRAIELAPSYADCRWYYGNFLLRAGRRDDAVAEFKLAAAD